MGQAGLANPVRVLVVDSDDDLREMLGLALTGMGLTADCAGGVSAARALLTQRSYRLCVTDLRLNDGDGLALVRHIRDHCPGLPVVVLTASASMEAAVGALRAGATDCLAKPVSLDELRALVTSTLDIALPAQRPQPVAVPVGVLVGEAGEIRALREQISSLASLRVPLVIRGEVGSGRELFARLVHAAGSRAERPFVAVDAAAVEDAIELFGRANGGDASDGLLHAADGGTLFLKEVDALPRAVQVRLARVIRDGRVRRLDAGFDEAVDVRVMSASTHSLGVAEQAGRLCAQLRHCLDVVEVAMPPLRERATDIPLLAAHILARLGEEAGLPGARCTDSGHKRLMAYSFPGNVRELECVLERSLAISRADVLDATDLRLPIEPGEAEVRERPG